MKIAVSSQGKTLDSRVDPRFGRATCFVLFDTETMAFSVVENASGQGGAGIAAGKIVIDAGAQAVLTGSCGPNAEQTLRAGNVRLFTDVSGTVAEAIERFRKGSLTEASGPNVQSHAGTGN